MPEQTEAIKKKRPATPRKKKVSTSPSKSKPKSTRKYKRGSITVTRLDY